MGRGKLNLSDWIIRLARLNDEFDCEGTPRRRFASLTSRLGLQNLAALPSHDPGAATIEPFPGAALAGPEKKLGTGQSVR